MVPKMLKMLLGLVAVSELVLAAPFRERRQAGCLSAFQNVPNVCRNNLRGQTFFPHPSDRTKFLQCDIYNRMYIIQCPQGEEFQLLTTSCQPAQQPITLQPVTVAPITTRPPITTRAPIFTRPPVTIRPPVTTPAVIFPSNSPCTPQNIARGQLYFPYPSDWTKFYECDLQGHPSVVSCPTLLVWDQTILSCVYPTNVNQTPSGLSKPTPHMVAGQPSNPCTSKAISEGRLFFPDLDQSKYIQCDLSGNAFLNSCPSHLVWNAFLETCYSPTSQIPSGRK